MYNKDRNCTFRREHQLNKRASKTQFDSREVVGYIRVSTLEQSAEGVSLAAQEERIKAYCVASGRHFDRIIVDSGQSAKTLSRDGLQGILSGITRKRIRAVVVLKLDRLTRSVRDLADVLELFAKYDCALVSVSEHVDTATASGRLLLNLLASVSQWEREAIGERTAFALAHKRRKGEVYGRVPFGFRREGDALVPNDEQQEALALIRQLRSNGTALRRIADVLNSRNIQPPKSGTRWYASSVLAVINSRMSVESVEAAG